MRLPSTTALLVVDVQNDFCSGGRLSVPHGEHVVPLINAILPRYETIVVTQDWHPADHASFASQHPGRTIFDTIDMPYGPQVLWPDHCVMGSDGQLRIVDDISEAGCRQRRAVVDCVEVLDAQRDASLIGNRDEVHHGVGGPVFLGNAAAVS